jgi:hypothetical protein
VKLSTLQLLGKHHGLTFYEGGENPLPDTEPMPGYWLVRCRCGWFTKSYHGEELAKELAGRHMFQVAQEIDMEPGGGNVRR